MIKVKYLTAAELALAQARINGIGFAKKFTAKKVFGPHWPDKDDDPYGLGERLQASVEAGQLSKIVYLGKRGDNNSIYDIG